MEHAFLALKDFFWWWVDHVGRGVAVGYKKPVSNLPEMGTVSIGKESVGVERRYSIRRLWHRVRP
jgi:hypothetical protein